VPRGPRQLGDDRTLPPSAHEIRRRLDLGPHVAGAQFPAGEQPIGLAEIIRRIGF